MAELGQTSDPRALIPGAPETIDADAAALTVHGKRVEQVGARLRSVTVGEWDGPAGARFAAMWVGEPPKWLKVADSIAAATAGMYSYAGMLRWAQGQAANAATLWEQAGALTRQGTANYQIAADRAAAQCQYIEPFVDPGEPLRREAQDILTHARDQLRTAGDQAARAIGGSRLGPALGPPGRGPGSALDTVKDALTGTASAWAAYSGDGVSATGKATFEGLNHGVETSGPDLDLGDAELTLGEVTGHAHLFDASASGSLSAGGANLAGTSSASYGGDMSASASAGQEGLEAHLNGTAGVQASAEINGSYGILAARATGTAMGGVTGDLGLDATVEKAGIKGEAFVGGKLAGDLGADIGGIGAGLHSEAWAGVGFKLDGGYEFKSGKFHLHGAVGAALGIGGSEGVDITVDPEEIGHTAMEAADALGRGAGGLAHHLGL